MRRPSNFRFVRPSIWSRNVFIQTIETPNPDSMKFYPAGIKILENGTADFPNLKAAKGSPLARALLSVEGVNSVFFSQDFVTVNKTTDTPWNTLKPALFETMMDFFASGKPVVDESGGSASNDSLVIRDDDDDVVAMIKEVLESRVRPAVMEDGGDIEYVGFNQGVVMLRMQGSCSGCPSSSATLKNGIERMLQHWVPEVTHVMAVEDDDLKKLNLEEFKKVEQHQ